jgi:hypothetical protein
MSQREPGTTVTLHDVWEVVVRIDKMIQPIPATLSDHETRLRALEWRLRVVAGVALVLGVALGQHIDLAGL